jgi:hypothetical protein
MYEATQTQYCEVLIAAMAVELTFEYIQKEGADGEVRMVIRCGLEGTQPFRPTLGLTHASCKMRTGSFPGIKRLGHTVYYPPHLVPRLKKE